ncbi:MAG: hypothetical protein R3199_00365 [Gemmatimonadota bacterium]|nr:hypothetical protein [Gemmatimonadota bacterium]
MAYSPPREIVLHHDPLFSICAVVRECERNEVDDPNRRASIPDPDRGWFLPGPEYLWYWKRMEEDRVRIRFTSHPTTYDLDVRSVRTKAREHGYDVAEARGTITATTDVYTDDPPVAPVVLLRTSCVDRPSRPSPEGGPR